MHYLQKEYMVYDRMSAVTEENYQSSHLLDSKKSSASNSKQGSYNVNNTLVHGGSTDAFGEDVSHHSSRQSVPESRPSFADNGSLLEETDGNPYSHANFRSNSLRGD
jgi:hypothetical protein